MPLAVRQTAGLLLKNNAATALALPSMQRWHTQSCLLQALTANERAVREAGGTAIARFVATGGMQQWKGLAAHMRQAAASDDANTVDGAADALVKVCEEAGEELEDADGIGQHIVDTLLMLTKCNAPRSRAKALHGLNALGQEVYPTALRVRIDSLLESLFALADDKDDSVRSRVCEGLIMVYQLHPEILAPRMKQLVHYMLSATVECKYEVAMQASEFWAALCEGGIPGQDASEILREILPQLVTGLMHNMVHSDDDDEVAAAEAEEEQHEQSSSKTINTTNGLPLSDTVKPVFHQNRSAHRAGARSDGADGGAAAGDDEDSDDDDDDDDLDDPGQWNLRKSSAAGLDTLSEQMGDEMLPYVLQEVQARMESDDWKRREVAVLALGAIAEGCASGLAQRLPEVVHAISKHLDDKRPMVRAIACWALSRYARLLTMADSSANAAASRLLSETVNGILARISDQNSKVKTAACTAVCNFAETAGSGIGAYCASIASALGNAFPLYPRQCLRVWFDAMGSLSSCVAHHTGAFASHDAVQSIFPPLLQFWGSSLGKAERDPFVLYSLANCLACMVSACGKACKQYAGDIVFLAAESAQAHVPYAQPLEPSSEALSACIELLSAVVDAFGREAEDSIRRSRADELGLSLCEHGTPEVRQSALGLIGDIAKHCLHVLRQEKAIDLALQSLAPECVVPENMFACSNALYALGELSATSRDDVIHQRALTISQAAAQMLSPSYPKMARENAAVALGRVGNRAASQLAPHVWDIAPRWFATLRHMRDGIEKRDAFIGASVLVETNSTGIGAAKDAAQLLLAISSWRDAHAYGNMLIMSLQRAVSALKAAIGDTAWSNETLPLLDSTAQTKLFLMLESNNSAQQQPGS